MDLADIDLGGEDVLPDLVHQAKQITIDQLPCSLGGAGEAKSRCSRSNRSPIARIWEKGEAPAVWMYLGS